MTRGARVVGVGLDPKRVRDWVLLSLGSVGFCSQVVAQFTGHEPSYLVMGGALSLLMGVPLLRHADGQDSK